jgi:hypothetical protein
MDNQSIILTREQLYEKVWSQSVGSLAKEIGIPDVGLAKICVRSMGSGNGNSVLLVLLFLDKESPVLIGPDKLRS